MMWSDLGLYFPIKILMTSINTTYIMFIHTKMWLEQSVLWTYTRNKYISIDPLNTCVAKFRQQTRALHFWRRVLWRRFGALFKSRIWCQNLKSWYNIYIYTHIPVWLGKYERTYLRTKEANHLRRALPSRPPLYSHVIYSGTRISAVSVVRPPLLNRRLALIFNRSQSSFWLFMGNFRLVLTWVHLGTTGVTKRS